MKKKIIIFDMDGVLFDTIPFAKESFLAGHIGMTDEMYKDIHCGNYFEGAQKYSHLKKSETEEEKNERKISYAKKKSESKMFEGIKDLLKHLHSEGNLVVLNTNAFDRNCMPLLDRSDITPLFDFLATAELSQSKIEKFKLIEEKYNANKKELIFITDALGDVKEADIAGIPTIAVTWGVHDKSFFEREKHPSLIGIVDTVKELEDFIEKY